ncbi:MAG TPA: rhomboid family intramembrane serine protease [Firmicutes bacterium]|jgi:membrane associated rhomboid family serine protease|nr:rhomboid family intramembrane serine protease [Bacillota bacterium]HBK68013.1 rhomboid family intramembrane serine protease [Bacillota bacterium]
MIPLKDDIPSRYPPFMTISLMVFTSLIFMFQKSLPPDQMRKAFYLFGLIPLRVFSPASLPEALTKTGRLLPFVSSIFLHGNWTHLIGNMWALWLFGDNIEDRIGSFRFLLFYLGTGVTAGVVHVLSNPAGRVPAIGASGAIAGVMGAYFLLYPGARVITLIPIFFIPYFLRIPAFLYLGGWFLTQLWGGAISFLGPGQEGGIAWWAHVGGFLTGLFAVRFFLLNARNRCYRCWYEDEYRPW